ncbi:MAG TPA: hypothetical protein VIV40_07915 [Kofleriaceae bacterium]
MELILVLALVSACNGDDDGHAVVPDAATSADAQVSVMDAPFQCMPVAPRGREAPAAACLALAPSTLQGATPFGNLDVALDGFSAGDCITISAAHINWTGACGERLSVQFSYPVVDTGSGRRVTGSFDSTARFEFQPPGMAAREDVTMVHVDVTTWQEGQDVHDIDITVSVPDPAYALAPLRVSGTFCDWPYYVC